MAEGGEKIQLKQIASVILEDAGDKIKNSQKCAFIIDTVGQVSIFLKYRDTNMINVLEPHDMQPETIRHALLGAMRYGKPMVLDLMDNDKMFKMSTEKFDEVQKGLMDALLDGSILKNEKFMSMVRSTDDAEYQTAEIYVLEKFKFIILTTNPTPEKELMDKTYPITVCNPE